MLYEKFIILGAFFFRCLTFHKVNELLVLTDFLPLCANVIQEHLNFLIADERPLHANRL